MYTPHLTCRACGYGAMPEGIKSNSDQRLVDVFNLGIQPLANDFCRAGEMRCGFAPLKVMFCPRCTLAQLSVVVSPNILYRNYAYVTSPSDMMRKHFEQVIKDMKVETDGRAIFEIGCNDGKFLSVLRDAGYVVAGIDPASNLVDIAKQSGLDVTYGYFHEASAREIRKVYMPDIIMARHVFCHVDNWMDFIRGIELLCNQNTIVCIEVPHVVDLLEKLEFDTIYHEHLSYLSIRSMHALLKNTSLKLYKVLRYPIHGGAIMLMLCPRSSQIAIDTSSAPASEHAGLSAWQAFSALAVDQIVRLKSMVDTFRAQGKRIAAIGASAKSTVWINACGFCRKDIEFISDDTPQKQLTFSPGTDIPVVDEGAIMRELPDYVIVFAWNYLEEILEKFAQARSRNVKFIVPCKNIDIV